MKFAVVGLGSMGRRRLRNLSYLGLSALAGMEPRQDRAAEVAAEFGIPVFSTFEETIAWQPDALVISTPPDRHTEYALAAARARIPFFTEASVVMDGMEELLAEAEAGGAVAAPSCTMRFHPAVGVLRERLAAGAIGRPLSIIHHSGQYLPDWHPWEDYRTFYAARRETGAAREIVPFELSWIVDLLGEVEAITGIRGKASDLETDIDDVYLCSFRLATGVYGSLAVEALSRPGNRLARIVGSEGTLVWDWQRKVVREFRAEAGDEWVEYRDPQAIEGPGGTWVPENMYVEEMRAYVQAVSGERPFPYTLADDLRLLRLTYAIEESSDRVLEAGV